jgi:hypothetical protein
LRVEVAVESVGWEDEWCVEGRESGGAVLGGLSVSCS